ncbi:MAG: hypothetical protein KDI83_02995 [Gammaproteobacteria bacterium]|nr:hypothetical protein [Gammaproteobacteria bacterium]
MPVSSALNIRQSVAIEYGGTDRREELTTLVNTLSYGLNFTGVNHSTSLHAFAYDARNFGRNDLSIQSASLSGTHTQRMSRYADFSLGYNINFSRQQGSATIPAEEPDPFRPDPDEADSIQGESSSLDVIYRHNRLFDVRNLRFQTRLRATADDLLLSGLSSSPNSEVLWENRLDYQVGKLDMSLRTSWLEHPGAEDGGSKSVMLTLSRYF